MTSGPPLPAEIVAGAPEFADELDEAIMLAAGGREIEPERRERWKITNLRQAEWAMRKLRAVLDRNREVSTQATEWRDQVSWWEESELRRTAPAAGFFTEMLKQWAIAERERTGEKTQHLPSGEIPTRAPSKPSVLVDDEAAVIRWARAHLTAEDQPTVVKESVSLAGLRAQVEVRPMPSDECADCGEPLEFYREKTMAGETVSEGWVHATHADAIRGHFPAPKMYDAVVFVNPLVTDPVLVPGVSIDYGQVTATVKPS